jgi:CO/xanthine dehydrogenase Mo-binding subunit
LQNKASPRVRVTVPINSFGAKEVGEGPIVVTVGAIAAAVSNAVGAFIPEMPMTPWKVLRVIRQNGLHQ